MEYTLRNGKTLLIRPPVPEDAEAMLCLMRTADTETPFLGRNPGEMTTTVEEERLLIEKNQHHWFVAVVDGQLVGQASAFLVRNRQRFCHRASLAVLVLASHWGLGIGGKLMQACLDWCRANQVEQAELDVVDGNTRALSMYESFGFIPVGRIPRALKYPDGTYADEIMMVKHL